MIARGRIGGRGGAILSAPSTAEGRMPGQKAWERMGSPPKLTAAKQAEDRTATGGVCYAAELRRAATTGKSTISRTRSYLSTRTAK